MVEKRRGLGRGLGALIPSAPAEESDTDQPGPVDSFDEVAPAPSRDATRKDGGRPVDLFFERVTMDDAAQQPRSYSSALRTGINKNVLDAQTKRVAKSVNGQRSVAAKVERETSPEDDGKVLPSPDFVGDRAAGNVGSTQRTEPYAEGAASDYAERTGGDAAGGPGEHVSRETNRSNDSTDGAGTVATDLDSTTLVEVPGARFEELPVDSIHPNRKQPRREFDDNELAELVHSIREIGVLQPVVVRPSQEGGEASYELVMGERRLRASREAGLEAIPAIIRSTHDDDLLRDALLENLHRSALNPLEEAAAYQQLLDDFGCSHEELAGRLGRSRPQISNTLRLMKLPPLVQRRVAASILSAGHARALLGLSDQADMEKLAQRIVGEGLSVRSTEEIVALSGGLRRASKPSVPRDGARHERLDYLATSLSDRLDTSVKITLGAKKGRVSIEFGSVDDLNRIMGVLAPTPR